MPAFASRVELELTRAGRHEEAVTELREAIGTFPRGSYYFGSELFVLRRLYEEAHSVVSAAQKAR
jgi:hypothetical protein